MTRPGRAVEVLPGVAATPGDDRRPSVVKHICEVHDGPSGCVDWPVCRALCGARRRDPASMAPPEQPRVWCVVCTDLAEGTEHATKPPLYDAYRP